MNWAISYIDVPPGGSLERVEEKAASGWEPFAVSPWQHYYKVARFWFKRRID